MQSQAGFKVCKAGGNRPHCSVTERLSALLLCFKKALQRPGDIGFPALWFQCGRPGNGMDGENLIIAGSAVAIL